MVAESNEPLSQSVFAGLCSMFVAFNSIVPYECMNVNTKTDICMIYFVEGVFMDISRIVELAKKQGKTMAHLCRLLGKTRSYLNDVRRGACVLPYNSIEIIAADLGTTPEYLLFETDNPSVPVSNQSMKSDVETALTEQEKLLLEMFRGTTEQGRMRIIQAVMNVCDDIEKKPARTDQIFVG